MDKIKPNYLITGGAGFIGSSLATALIENNATVFCIDNFDPFYSEKIKQQNIGELIQHPNFKLFRGDIQDKKFLQSVFSNHKIDTVVHLAAKAGVRPSILNPLEYNQTNVIGTLNILECLKEFNVKKLVFASSSSVYGNNKKVPFAETDNVDFPISPYAATKKAGELLTHTYHHLYNIDIINLRFFTVYGPKQRPDLAIHKFCKKILNDEPIEIYGDGNTGRDYTFIDDIVSGIINSIEYNFNNNNVYEIINLGNSHPVKLHELINTIEKITNRSFKKMYLPLQDGDVDLTFADISKAKNLLNYNPKTNIEDGLKQFLNWLTK